MTESKRRHREYQHQHRAWKKAELQNISTAAIVAQIGLASSPAGEKYLQPMHFVPMHFVHRLIYHEPPFICEGANFGTGLSTIVENDETTEPTDWLHRNDNYVPGRRGPRTDLSRPFPTSGEAGQHILDFFLY